MGVQGAAPPSLRALPKATAAPPPWALPEPPVAPWALLRALPRLPAAHTFIEHLLRYGNAYQAQKAQSMNSLFGDSEDILSPEPKIPPAREWSLIEKLTKEKEVTGIYISGHPLDDYKLEIENYTTCTLEDLENQS